MYPQASNKGVNGIAVSSYRTGCPKLHICSNGGSSIALNKYAHIYKLNIIVFNLLYM
jgi:hypothetical protein